MQIKVMLVDDHLLFLEGLQYLLEIYGVDVVGKSRDGEEALVKAQILKPDIILMDISMPNSSGLEALARINAKLPHIKIIMLTTSERDEDLFHAMKLGASGYLLKNTDGKRLIEYLEDAMKGEMPLSPGLASRIIGELKRSQNKENCEVPNKQMIARPELTERQLEVLELIARGLT